MTDDTTWIAVWVFAWLTADEFLAAAPGGLGRNTGYMAVAVAERLVRRLRNRSMLDTLC